MNNTIKYFKPQHHFESQFNLTYLPNIGNQFNTIETPKNISKEFLYLDLKHPSFQKVIRSFKKNNYLYALKFPSGTKIGITTNISTRIPAYFRPWCSEIEGIYIIQTDYKNISSIEKKLKTDFKFLMFENSTEFVSNKIDFIKVVESIHNTTFKQLSPLYKRKYDNSFSDKVFI